MTNPNLGQPVKNKHKVPLKQWNKWSNFARRVFNTMMYSLRPSMQFAFLHPDAKAASLEHWQTTRWNVAWEAAQVANGGGSLGRVFTVETPRSKSVHIAGTKNKKKKKKAVRHGK